MKQTVKFLALILALLTVLSVVVACGKDQDGDGNEETSDVATSEKPQETDDYGQVKVDDGLDGLDFEGKTVNILVRNGDDDRYFREWYSKETENLSALQREVFERNATVEQRLDVKLNFIPNSKADEKMNELIETAGKGGTGAYDIVSNYAAYATTTNVLQYYMNLYNDQFSYMKLDQPYWNQAFINNAAAFDRLFVIVGDMNLSVYDRAIVLYYNLTKAETWMPDTDIYNMVLDKQWTYQEFYDIVANIAEDGGTPEDESDDFYGVTSIKGSEFCDGFLYSLGASLTQTDDEGNHTLVTDTNYTRLANAFTMTANFWGADGAKNINGSDAANKFFTGGQALFFIDIIYHTKSQYQNMVNMEDGYGVLPLPMYDIDQEKYYAGIQDAHGVTSVVCHFKQDYEMVGAVLEALNSESYSSVRPFYIENVIKGQYLNADGKKVFELILNGTRWDFADVYSTAIGGVRNKIWRGPIQKGTVDITTDFTGAAPGLNENLGVIDTWLKEHY